LNQIGDYFHEGFSRKFESISVIRQYLGEKIAYFFAWKSFITCYLFCIGVVGLPL